MKASQETPPICSPPVVERGAVSRWGTGMGRLLVQNHGLLLFDEEPVHGNLMVGCAGPQDRIGKLGMVRRIRVVLGL